MKHSYFEDILLIDDNEIISNQQARALSEHIKTCASCREKSLAWTNVDRLLSSAPQVAPRTGFSTRWQERLEQERKYHERMQIWTILSLTLGGALLVWIMLIVWVMTTLGSPVGWFLVFVTRLVEFFILLGDLTSFLGSVGGIIPITLWIGLGIGLVIILSGLSGLWVLCMQKIFVSQRIEI